MSSFCFFLRLSYEFSVKRKRIMNHLQISLLMLIEFKRINFKKKKKKTNFMAPFYGWGSTASRLEPLRGGSLLFTTKFPEIPGTHFIDLGRMKG